VRVSVIEPYLDPVDSLVCDLSDCFGLAVLLAKDDAPSASSATSGQSPVAVRGGEWAFLNDSLFPLLSTLANKPGPKSEAAG
jgi:hypothetical protein